MSREAATMYSAYPQRQFAGPYARYKASQVAHQGVRLVPGPHPEGSASHLRVSAVRRCRNVGLPACQVHNDGILACVFFFFVRPLQGTVMRARAVLLTHLGVVACDKGSVNLQQHHILSLLHQHLPCTSEGVWAVCWRVYLGVSWGQANIGTISDPARPACF